MCKLIPILFVNCLVFSSHLFASKYEYRKRGEGNNARYEGTKRDKTAGSLSLLSFVSYMPNWRVTKKPQHLNIKFYSPKESFAHILVREVRNYKSYRMDVMRNSWNKGWSNHFNWSTIDVIEPLKVKIDNLGYVISEKRFGGSGTIFPAVVYTKQPPTKITSYSLIVRSKFTCTPLTWTISKLTSKGESKIKSGSIRRLPAGKPQAITIDALSLEQGWYRLRLKWERAGRGPGGSSAYIQKRYYDFYHIPSLK